MSTHSLLQLLKLLKNVTIMIKLLKITLFHSKSTPGAYYQTYVRPYRVYLCTRPDGRRRVGRVRRRVGRVRRRVGRVKEEGVSSEEKIHGELEWNNEEKETWRAGVE